MKISRKYVPALTVLFIGVGVGLAVLLALFFGVGTARAGSPDDGDYSYCGTSPEGLPYCCTGHEDWGGTWYEGTQWCTGEGIEAWFGCPMVIVRYGCEGLRDNGCYESVSCAGATGGDTWLADVCEPNDGFSDAGQMTWDSDHAGPLQVAASPDGPWYEVQVNGPPWVVTEEMMNAFAGMVGLEDWHEMWLRSGDGNPQHVGNAIIEREGHMDTLCNP